jgi:hypothetical protein
MRLGVLSAVIAVALAAAPSAGAWAWPVEGPVLQQFALGDDPYAGGQHRGVDIGASSGSPVLAPASGVVSFAGVVPMSGKSVTIQTPDGYSVTLTHLGSIGVARSATVSQGAAVATIGPSGQAEHDVPYVHLGIRWTSDPQGYLDPLLFLPPPRTAPAASPPPPAAPPPPAPPPTQSPPAPAAVAPAPPVRGDASVGSRTSQPAAARRARVGATPTPGAQARGARPRTKPGKRMLEASRARGSSHTGHARLGHGRRGRGSAAVAATVVAAAQARRMRPRIDSGGVGGTPRALGSAETGTTHGEGEALKGRSAGLSAAAARAHARAAAPAARRRSPVRRPSPLPLVFGLGLAFTLVAAVVAGCRRSRRGRGAGHEAARMMVGDVRTPELAPHSEDATEPTHPRRARVAVCERPASSRARRRVRRPVGHLRPLPPLEGQPRPHGERDRRARHAGHGRRRQGRGVAA